MATPVRMPTRHRASWHRVARPATVTTATVGTAAAAAPGRATTTALAGATRFDTSYGVTAGATVVHGATTRRRHRLSPLALGIPLVLGIIYGAYAAAIARDGGQATNGQLALALVSGVVLFALLVGLLLVQHSLPREPRAAAWGAVTGAAVGFLVCLSGHSVFSSSGLGLLIAACVTAAVFYVLYTREPRES
ncbi:hypothetical protein [Streptomyces sp. NPDC093109]|uniref:hypothetical protein n=1 Tax=Streptomyces sp. NPDC093109 TaxID=3154977 RepID=UPI00344DFB3F